MVWFGSSGSSRSSPMGWVASNGSWVGAEESGWRLGSSVALGEKEAGSAGETRSPSTTRAHFSALVSAFQ
jgi:hypothetical protein